MDGNHYQIKIKKKDKEKEKKIWKKEKIINLIIFI
jgi:hypothetical protein